MTINKILVIVVALLFIGGAAVMVAYMHTHGEQYGNVDSEDPYFTTTNSIGTDVKFYKPSQKAAVLGLAFSTTLLELGCGDDIVMIDNHSAPLSSGVTELNLIPAYPVGDGQQIAQLLADGLGGFDANRDVVFLYGYSYHATAIASMEQMGLKVVTFYPQTYEEGMDMITAIGAITGRDEKAAGIVNSMQKNLTYYADKLEEHGITSESKVNAIYVSYSGGVLRVGNVNSYSVILMKIAGGANVADNPSMTGSSLTSYQVDNTIFIQSNPDVIFLDPYYAGTPSDFRAEMNIGPDVKIFKLDMVMNQYGPTSLDGIEFMAQAMYPQIFGYPDENRGMSG